VAGHRLLAVLYGRYLSRNVNSVGSAPGAHPELEVKGRGASSPYPKLKLQLAEALETLTPTPADLPVRPMSPWTGTTCRHACSITFCKACACAWARNTIRAFVSCQPAWKENPIAATTQHTDHNTALHSQRRSPLPEPTLHCKACPKWLVRQWVGGRYSRYSGGGNQMIVPSALFSRRSCVNLYFVCCFRVSISPCVASQ
jgi:hypothetical protein